MSKTKEKIFDEEISPDLLSFLRKYVGWTFQGNEKVLLIKDTKFKNVYKVFGGDDLFGKCGEAKDANGVRLMTVMAEEFKKLQVDGLTHIGVKTIETEEKELTIYNTLLQCSKKLMVMLQQDSRLFISDIVQFTNDENVPAYCYFDLNLVATGEHYFWTMFESQMASYAVPIFRAFIYSIFKAGSKGRQILYLYDDGDTGKSKILSALTDFGGISFSSSIQPTALSDKFFGTYFFGYRLITAADITASHFSKFDIIKKVSGGDKIPCEFKNRTPFFFYPDVKIFVITNKPPALDLDKKHQTSRTIAIKLTKTTNPEYLKHFSQTDEYGNLVYEDGEPIPIGFNGLVDELVKEMPAYLATAKHSYETLCPHDGEIILSKEFRDAMKNVESDDSAFLRSLVDEYLEFGDKKKIFVRDLAIIKKIHQTNLDMNNVDKDLIPDFLKKKSCVKGTIRIGNQVTEGYRGVGLNANWKIENNCLVRVIKNQENEDEI
jgi:hypothetical protein